MNLLNTLEIDILLWLHQRWSCPALDVVAKALDWLGDDGRAFILLALVLLCIPRTRTAGLVLATALVLDGLVVNLTLKPLVARVRPYDWSHAISIIVHPPGGLSFPSGHTAVAFAAAFALWPVGPRVRGAALAFAAVMGLSRLYLMVHYPTDVLAGALVGSLCGLCSIWLWKKIQKRGILN